MLKPNKPLLTQAHRDARVRHAEWWIEMDESWRKAVVFSDEKYFVIGSTPRTAWIRVEDEPPTMETRTIYTTTPPEHTAHEVDCQMPALVPLTHHL